MYFLTINTGSSSIKFCLFDVDSLSQDYSGNISGIGSEAPTFSITSPHHNPTSREIAAPDHQSAITLIQAWLEENTSAEQLAAIGHRVVHGGPFYNQSCVITDEVISKLRSLIPFDPEHLPLQIALVEQVRSIFAHVPQIACFDTAFFHDLPTESKLLTIPRKYEAQGIRRYGFHGLSYAFLLQEFEHIAGREAAHGNVIFAHLGSGASLAALQGGKPIDTSMSLTPASGIPMSTRSGDLDPGIMSYLATTNHQTPEQFSHMIGFESGLLGISETTSDMKKLLELEVEDQRAKDAVDIFCYQTKKYIGAYAAALGGLNSLVFSGGIGEVAPKIRERICAGLEFLGIQLDAERNAANAELISAESSSIGVHVLTTNEAMTMARDMARIQGSAT